MIMKVLAKYYPYYVSGHSAQKPDGGGEEAGYYYSDQGQDKHLRDYWNILVKRRRLIVTIFCGTVALGIIVNFLMPTQFAAKSTLQIEPQNLNITGVGGVAEGIRERGAGPVRLLSNPVCLAKEWAVGSAGS